MTPANIAHWLVNVLMFPSQISNPKDEGKTRPTSGDPKLMHINLKQ